MQSNQDDPNRADDFSPSHFVAIGASAGGLEAIESFFNNMIPQSRLAFIVVQHLSPDYKSLMVELLSKRTEMKVHRAENGMKVLAENVYLIPPKKNLTIFNGKLILQDKNQHEGINLPIDIFLRSLAEDQAEKAIAIILSGTGSDGARGVRAIKENNGIVMVQEEKSAKFDGMPRAAISTGVIDYVLAPEKMPSQLLAYVAHPYISGEKRAETLLEDSNALTRLFAELRMRTKVDFTYYKPSTITRRIERRMSINQINDFDEYVRYLQSFPGEVSALHRELLIGVTSFFRDPEAMQELQDNVLPELCTNAQGREIRCWISGCSSGEEAFTLAIMFKEAMEDLGINQDVKIFATDVDREATLKASTGVYPESIAADLSPRILGKYFYHIDEAYKVARNVREMVVFAQHNLVKDPPFTNIDLISCRNLLIYLQPVLQEKALESFNFSLNSGGILFLGNSETIGEMTDYFQPLHNRHRIYRSRGKHNPLRNPNIGSDTAEQRRGTTYDYPVRKHIRPDIDKDVSILRPYLEALSESYFRLSMIINERMEVEHIIGNSEGLLSIPSGPMEYDITRLTSKDLSIPLATGIQKVLRSSQPLIYNNLHLQSLPEEHILSMRILPLPKRKGQESFVAVFIEEKEQIRSENGEILDYDLSRDAQLRIKDLEQELQFARENLQATIEELETSNEELQATNEELMASNEELQSTNEELQSTNEELYTVNAEHQNKIIELTELSNDVDNLLSSSGIGTLIVDENLAIRKFSPEITHIFNILEKDIGRPFSHISHHIKSFDPVEAVMQVLADDTLLERDVQTKDGSWYLTRVIPYAVGPQTYSGIVLTFVDITELRIARANQLASEKSTRQISENIPLGLFIFAYDDEHLLMLESNNQEAERLIGLSGRELYGKTLEQIFPKAEQYGLSKRLYEVLETGEPYCFQHFSYCDDHLCADFRLHAFLLPGNHLALTLEDITTSLATTKQLETSEEKYQQLFECMNLGVVYQDQQGQITRMNPAAEKILGFSFKEIAHLTSDDPRWQATDSNGISLLGNEHPSMVALNTGEPVTGFIMGIFSGNKESTKWLSVNATPLFNDGSKRPFEVFTTFEDVTERITKQ